MSYGFRFGGRARAAGVVAGLAVAACLVAASPAAAQSQTGWDLAITGGFVVTGLTDPIYSLGTVTGRPTRVVIREDDQESKASLGVAMFGQVYHDRWPWVAPLSFGIGVRGDSRATYYLGSALRLGSHASITGGVAFGPVATLPPGVHEQAAVSDTNQLLDLPSRMARSWFTGVTYTFSTIR